MKKEKRNIKVYGAKSAIVAFNKWKGPRRVVLNVETKRIFTVCYKPSVGYIYTLIKASGPVKTTSREVREAATKALKKYFSLDGENLAIDLVVELASGAYPKEENKMHLKL
jgi:hypothetical protein